MQLLLRYKNCAYVLVRYLDEFHLAPVEHPSNADAPAESDCESFPVKNLHSIVISGTRAGEQIFLYIGSRERKFTLAEDTTEDILGTVFAGVERIQTTSGLESHSREPDWRESLQNKPVQNITRIVGIGLNIFAFVSTYNMLSEHDELMNMGRIFPVWTILATATMVILLTMFVAMPQYFTLDLWKRARKEIGCTAKVTDLKLLFPIMIFVCCNILHRDYTSWLFMLALVAAISLLLVWLACKVCRALREDQLQRWIFAAMLAVILFNTIACVNDFANPDRYRVKGHRIISTDYFSIPGRRGRGSSEHHYCTVATPSGREINLGISEYEYDYLKPGDWAVAYVGTGALGIEYGYHIRQFR